MDCWQTIEFWMGTATGIIVSYVFWAWSTWIYGRGIKSTEKSENEAEESS